MTEFFQRLKERKLVQWAIAYVAAAFALLQGIDIIASRFGWPGAIERILIIASCIGFFVVLVLAWFHGERGVQRVTGFEVLILALLLSLGGGLLWRFSAGSASPKNLIAALPAESGFSTPRTAISTKSIAVLPFENLSDDKQNEYFSEGIQDEVLTRLAKIADLKVISRTSTRRFKGSREDVRTIAQQLGVAHLLEGSVQKSGDQVRVIVQLINAEKDVHLWAETYDRKLTDIFAVEAEIARNVAKSLQAQLTGTAEQALETKPTENPEAHKLYLQGAYYNSRGTEPDYRKAIDYYREAVKLDPRYALAHTGLSTSLINLARKFLGGVDAQQVYAEARAAVETALGLEPNLADAHSVHGFVLESADFNWIEAAAEYRRAIELEPHNDAAQLELASSLASLGHVEEAAKLARQQLESDPLCASCYNRFSGYLVSLGQLDQAENAIRRAIYLQASHADFYTQLTLVAVLRGDAKAALDAAEHEISEGGWQEIALALAQQISGDSAAADAALQNLIDHQASDAAFQIAEVYALRKDPDKMFEWLDRAWSNRDPGVSQLLYDPLLLRYRDDPRFAAYCQKIGLPAPATGDKHDQ